MNSTDLKTKVTPFLAIVLIVVLWTAPLGLGVLGTIPTALVVIFASFIEYGKKAFEALGLSNFKANSKAMLITAPLLAGALFLAYYFILVPTVTAITDQPIDLSQFEQLKGNVPYSLFMLAFVWVSAAFGEEIVWRGYLMRQFVKFFGDGTLSLVINILLFGILFGYCHAYQGITGQILSGIVGMVLAIIFYKRKYNLWLNIAIHGISAFKMYIS